VSDEGEDPALEAHRLRATAEDLIQIADRCLGTSAADMSPAESARVGAATRLAVGALRIVSPVRPAAFGCDPRAYRKV
jgi:hypothetical protein